MEIILNYLFAAGITFSHIFGYVFSLISLIFIYKNWNNLKREKIFLLISLFLAYGLILSLFSNDRQISFEEMFNYAASWLPPFVLGYYVVNEKAKYKIILTYIAVFSFIVALS
ncbi:MAG: hypothetical protein WC234_07020, partial [Endomicrobiaceae bacterium]